MEINTVDATNRESQNIKTDYILGARRKTIDPEMSDFKMYWDFLNFAQKSVSHEHYLRYCQTVSLICRKLEYSVLNSGFRVLETGGLSLVAEFLADRGCDVSGTTSDLRYSIDAPSGEADLVLSLEVIEHLKDQAETSFSEVPLFQMSGVKNYLSEIKRVVAKDGLLMITTPNPCSVRSIQNIISFKPPEIFRPHVREYTRDELYDLLNNSGFEVIDYGTNNSFFNILGIQNSDKLISELFEGDLSGRGDDHFLFAKNA